MADNIRKLYAGARFILRKDSLENWQTKNPVLLAGELSYVTDGEDNKKIKFGDGITPWNDLAYFSSGTDVEVDQTYNPESENAQSGIAVAKAVTEETNRIIETGFINENIYDEEKNSVLSGTQYRIGTVALNGTEQFVVVSTGGKDNFPYIETIQLYDEADVEITNITITSSLRNTTFTRSGKKVTIPTNARKMMFKYRFLHASSGRTLCFEMMATVGEAVPLIYKKGECVNILKNSPYVTKEYVDKTKIFYVSTSGSDDNDGLSKETALASITKAISLGAKEIAVEVGDYFATSKIVLTDLNNVHIYAYRNNEVYSHSSPIRDKVNIIFGEYFSEYSLNADGVYQQANAEGFDFSNVFISKIKTPNITNRTYHANVMVLHNDKSKDYYLKPVLTYDECVSTNDTFYWDGSTLFFNPIPTDFIKIGVVKFEESLLIENSNNIVISDICFSLTKLSVVNVKNSNEIIFNNCEANASATNMGFAINNSNVILNNCYTTKNAYDGFNFHDYGTSIMNDCFAENNYDDGCSHHDGCIGTINGGRFNGSGKAGIAPAYGANVNIYNAVCEDNHIGIGYLTTTNGHANMKGVVSGCLLKNNDIGLTVGSLATVTAIGCEYKNNVTDKEGIE